MSINNHPLFISIGPTAAAARASVSAAGTGNGSGDLAVLGTDWTSGANTVLMVRGGLNTGITASEEAPDVLIDLDRTVTWATGAITSQRAVKIKAPTLAFVAASTVTNAATVYIDRAPVAGTNATITNAFALWIAAGTSRFDGALSLTGDIKVGLTDSSGTPGAATINKAAGKVAVALGASAVTVTNSLVTAASIVICVLQTADATLTTIRSVVPGAGSFVITGNANATAATTVAFLVINPA